MLLTENASQLYHLPTSFFEQKLLHSSRLHRLLLKVENALADMLSKALLLRFSNFSSSLKNCSL